MAHQAPRLLGGLSGNRRRRGPRGGPRKGSALHVILFFENLRRALFIFHGLRSRYCQRAFLVYHYPTKSSSMPFAWIGSAAMSSAGFERGWQQTLHCITSAYGCMNNWVDRGSLSQTWWTGD